MKGQILDFSVQKNEGVISAADGARYTFSGSEWKGDVQPNRGMWVDFEAQENNAIGVYRALVQAASAPRGNKSKAAATLWGAFLGGLGAHKFYMGSWGWGIVYLLTCWLYIPFITQSMGSNTKHGVRSCNHIFGPTCRSTGTPEQPASLRGRAIAGAR